MRIELNACCLGLQAHQTPHMCRRENQGKSDGTGWKLEEVSDYSVSDINRTKRTTFSFWTKIC